MKKSFFAVFLSIALFALPHIDADAADALSSTVTCSSQGNNGHAVCIYDDGEYKYFATCSHILGDSDTCVLAGDGFDFANISVVYHVDNVRDLTILRTSSSSLPSITPAIMCEESVESEPVYCQERHFNAKAFTGEIICSLWHDPQGIWAGRTTIPIQKGFSGSGVFNEDGMLLGIIYQYTTYTDGGVYSEYIRSSDISSALSDILAEN